MRKSTTTPIPIFVLGKKRNSINIRPVFQRNLVWGKANKQLLIDSILKDYYIPEVIFGTDKTRQYEFIVIDGQQRLSTIFEFLDDDLRIANHTQIDGIDVSGKTYSQLPEELKSKVESYLINYVEIEGTDAEIQNMFLRLQNQVNLTKAERRHSINSDLRAFVDRMLQHDFFVQTCEVNDKTNRRLKYNEVIEQFLLLELYGIIDIKDTNLQKMYEDYPVLEPDMTDKMTRILDYLFTGFGDKYGKNYFRKANLHGLYLVMTDYVDQDRKMKHCAKFRDWFITFENARKEQKDLPFEQQDEVFQQYSLALSSGTGSKISLEKRKEILTASWKRFLKGKHI